MAENRISRQDLSWAADWLDQYNDGDDADPTSGEPDEASQVARRVAAWLRAEVERRDMDALARAVATRTGRKASDPAVRAAVKRTRATA